MPGALAAKGRAGVAGDLRVLQAKVKYGEGVRPREHRVFSPRLRLAPTRAGRDSMRMALGTPQRKKTPIGCAVMLAALALSAFLGGALGLVFQNSDWFGEEAEEETVTVDQPTG